MMPCKISLREASKKQEGMSMQENHKQGPIPWDDEDDDSDD